MVNSTEDVQGHRARLRARLELEPLSVADYEIMELILGLSLKRKDTKPLAKELIKRFGGLRGALDARPDELLQVPGFGPGLMALWRLLRELMARHALEPLRTHLVLVNSQSVAEMARPRLAHLSHEESWLALVDAQNRLTSWERVRRGSISSIAIEPRDILEIALTRKANGAILVHNHPGGNPTPSQADIALTNEIQSLASRLGLRFLDHVIITSGDCYSIIHNKLIQFGGFSSNGK